MLRRASSAIGGNGARWLLLFDQLRLLKAPRAVRKPAFRQPAPHYVQFARPMRPPFSFIRQYLQAARTER